MSKLVSRTDGSASPPTPIAGKPGFAFADGIVGISLGNVIDGLPFPSSGGRPNGVTSRGFTGAVSFGCGNGGKSGTLPTPGFDGITGSFLSSSGATGMGVESDPAPPAAGSGGNRSFFSLVVCVAGLT